MVLPWRAQQLIAEVEQVFERASSQTELQVQSDYAKYLVVRVSGMVEQVIIEVVSAHVAPRSSPTVAARVSWSLRTFQNPSIDRVLQLVASFNRLWRDELELTLTIEERDALSSINTQRNRIAHGEDSTVSLVQVRQYHDEIKKLLSKVADKF